MVLFPPTPSSCLFFSYGDAGKRCTLTVSNELPAKRPDSRNKSTLNYEYSFDTPETGPLKKFVPWSEFRPFYRGKEVDDAKPLETERVRRWSFMMRSFFDKQEGDFSLKLRRVCSYQN